MEKKPLMKNINYKLIEFQDNQKDEYDQFLCNKLPSHTILKLYKMSGTYTITMDKNWYKNKTRVSLIIRCSDNEHILIPYYMDEQENYFKQETALICTIENYIIEDVVITEKNIASEFDEGIRDYLNEQLLKSRTYIVSKEENSPYSVIEKIIPSIDEETKERSIRIDTLYVDDIGRLIDMNIGQEESISKYNKEYSLKGK